MLKGLFNKKTPVEKYMAHLDSIFQTTPEFFMEESLDNNLHGVSTIVYRDIPEKGMITSFTYGLSLGNHPDWKNGKPELTLTVKSDNFTWGRVSGYLANWLRGHCPFTYGNPINFEEKISDDSEMDAFLVFAPSIFTDKNQYNDINIGTKNNIFIKGIYPIYSSEIEYINNNGLEKFWKHPDFDMYDITRKRIE